MPDTHYKYNVRNYTYKLFISSLTYRRPLTRSLRDFHGYEKTYKILFQQFIYTKYNGTCIVYTAHIV